MASTDLTTASERTLAGSTTISRKALLGIAQAATHQTLRVNPDDVSVSTFDDHGKLGLTVSTALRSDDVERCSVRPDMTVFSLIEQARTTIKERMQTVSGHSVGHVNIYVDGIAHISDERRELQ
ncbi:MAG: hypothetical protein Q4B10_03795 [Actinomycetaceae bacterium]|nr:hypothetical protein [Actinomycetaceae bacterium]